MTYSQWKVEVDRLCQQHLMCSWADLSGDEPPLRIGYEAGETPREFVRNVAQKYDLVWREICRYGKG